MVTSVAVCAISVARMTTATVRFRERQHGRPHPSAYGELNGWGAERSKRKAGEIYDTLEELFEIAREEGIPTNAAADRLAERRIQQVGAIHRTWL